MKPPSTLSDDALLQAARRAVHELTDAPAAWQQAAQALMPAAAVPPSPWQAAAAAVVRRLQALLSFDSAALPLAPAGAMRSAGASPRHLLYSVDGRDVDLRISGAGAAFALAGQLLGPDESGLVELAIDDGAGLLALVAPLDAWGEFRLADARPGVWTLTFRLGADEIVLPAIEVR